MTENKQAQPGHNTQSTETNPRRGAIAIPWLVAILVALVVMVLVINRMARQAEPASAGGAGIPSVAQADAAKILEGPVVKLADIDNSRIGTSVTISGKVVDLVPPPADSKRPYALKVADDSGEKTINFWQMEYDQIQGKESLNGAQIRACVSVSSYKEQLQLKLASGANLEIVAGPAAVEPPPPVQTPATRDFSRGRSGQADSLSVGEVTAAHDGQTLRVRGQVASVSAPKEGTKQPFAVILKDGDATLRVSYWPAVDEVIAVKPVPGAVFEMEGVVEVYKDKPQLKIESGFKVQQVEAATVAAMATPAAQAPQAAENVSPAVGIASITAAHDGQTLRVRGRVASVSAPQEGTKQPYAVILKEGEASLRVTYWSNVNDVITVKPTPGALFEMEGVVEVFKDQPQLKIKSGYKVKQVEAAPAIAAEAAPAAEAGPAGTIASITAADKGQTRSVQGTLGAPRALGKGTAYALTDDSGTIDLILWDSIIPADVRSSLSEGMRVTATGVVGEYDGKLQLKASPGTSIRAIP